MQTLAIEIEGDVLAARASGSNACHGDTTCHAGCRTLFVTLNGLPSVGPDLVCHVTVTSTRGEVVERDVVASERDRPCCSGYEFPVSSIGITFLSQDTGSEDGSADAQDTRD